ncbi:heavy metal-binding domain-containing protein [bacterium]|nr:heavy metal-binding domain-containing protein [bacterium]
MINREDLLAGTRPEVGSRVLVTEKESFEGYQVMDYKGVVWGISMRAKDIVQDSLMGCKNVTGGELTSYTELSDEVRQRAWDRMVTSARRIGANAVINFRFEITPVIYGTGGTAEVIAYGNAVVIEPIKNYVPLGGLGNILAEFVDSYAGNPTSNIKPQTKKSPKAEITQNGEFTYVVCPECQLKYKVTKDENGKIRVMGLSDVDPNEDGLQIFCSRCGTKFTIPEE